MNSLIVSPVKRIRTTLASRPGTLTGTPSLSQCQISTPDELVRLVWRLVNERRSSGISVIDLGAGDGRFALHGNYASYVGYEIDHSKYEKSQLPGAATIVNFCALASTGSFDVAIGNPPFIRYQDVKDSWKTKARNIIMRESGMKVNGCGNLYQYFMWQALFRTKRDGMVALIVPLEWTYRPSAEQLRNYIWKNKWSVSIYRLPDKSYFSRIGAVPCVTIIDKSRSDQDIAYHQIDQSLSAVNHDPSSEMHKSPFAFARGRDNVYATRGLSTGSQQLFLLTEAERKRLRVSLPDVVPCVTTLRPLKANLTVLTQRLFQENYVCAGRKCWLLRTDKKQLPPTVKAHLDAAPSSIKRNTTCRARSVWYKYRTPSPPAIVYSASFVKEKRPKMLLNEASVRCIGSVHGIFGPNPFPTKQKLMNMLTNLDFRQGTLPTIQGLRKIEIRQMNGILRNFYISPSRRGGSNGTQ